MNGLKKYLNVIILPLDVNNPFAPIPKYLFNPHPACKPGLG